MKKKTATKKSGQIIVINTKYGGFNLSTEAYEWLIKNKNWTVTTYNEKGNYTDPNADLVKPPKGLSGYAGKGYDYFVVDSDRCVRMFLRWRYENGD